MAWFWANDSFRPGEQPDTVVLGDSKKRMHALWKLARQDVLRRDPEYKYVTEIDAGAGFRLQGVDQPFRVKVESKSIDLPRQFGVQIGIAISSEVISIIEDLEQGIHNYLPLELEPIDGTVAVGSYYILNICTRLDTLSPEHSENMARSWPDKKRFPDLVFYRGGSLMVKKGPAAFAHKIAGHHLWYEYKAFRRMMSDQLMKRLMDINAMAYADDNLNYVHPVKEV